MILTMVASAWADDDVRAIEVECDRQNDYIVIEPFMRWTDAQGNQRGGPVEAKSTLATEIQRPSGEGSSTYVCDTGHRQVTISVKDNTLSLREVGGAVDGGYSIDLTSSEAEFVWSERRHKYMILSRAYGTWSTCHDEKRMSGSALSERKCSAVSLVKQ